MPESPIVAMEPRSNLVVIQILVESLGEEQLRRLQAEVRAAADANPGKPVALDFSRVSFLPSLSLAALIRIHSEIHKRQRLILAGLQPQVRNVFVMTRLDRLFELHENVDAAQRAVQPV